MQRAGVTDLRQCFEHRQPDGRLRIGRRLDERRDRLVQLVDAEQPGRFHSPVRVWMLQIVNQPVDTDLAGLGLGLGHNPRHRCPAEEQQQNQVQFAHGVSPLTRHRPAGRAV